VGVLGGFTTFSSFSYETLALLQDGEALAALTYALGSLLLGFFLAYLGYRLGGMLVA
jgi:CrcB protein